MINEAIILEDSGFEILKSTYRSNKDMSQMHYHKHYEILYVYNNTRLLVISEKKYVLDKDTVALIPPFIPHLTVSGGVLPEKRVLINFHESYIHDIRNILPIDLLSCFSTPCTVMSVKQILDKFCAISQSIYESESETERLLQLSQLLFLLSSNAPAHTSNKSFDEMIRYIEANYHEKITLDLLAEKFYLSRFTISRYFANYAGTSLPQYLNSIRVINAKRYLKDGMKVTEVAFRCGFESTTNFDRVFKTKVGMVPSRFQKENVHIVEENDISDMTLDENNAEIAEARK